MSDSTLSHSKAANSGMKPAKCNYCKATFLNQKFLNYHEKRCIHAIKKCKFCDRVFSGKFMIYKLALHEKWVHTNPLAKCSICNKMFSNACTLLVHVKMIHPNANFVCRIKSCQQKFRTYQLLIRHEKIHKKQIRFRHKPKDSKKSANNRLKPLKVEQADETKIITECVLNSQVKSEFLEKVIHNKTIRVQKSQEKVYTCSFKLCQRKYFKYYDLKKHERSHLKWEHCGNIFASKVAYERHLETHSKTKKIKKELKCRYCAVVFSSTKSVRYHEIRSHERKVYKCKINSCHQIFPDYRARKDHEMIHFKKKYEHCGLIFASAPAFKKHLRNHIMIEKTHECNANIKLEPGTVTSENQIDHNSIVRLEPNTITNENRIFDDSIVKLEPNTITSENRIFDDSIVKLEPNTITSKNQIFDDSIVKLEPNAITNKNQMGSIVKLEPISITNEIQIGNDSGGKLKPTTIASKSQQIDIQEIMDNHPENENIFECVCGLKLSKLSDLQQHHFDVHSKVPRWLKRCQFCKFKYNDEAKFTSHMKRHTGELTFKCKFCGEILINKKQWLVHEALKCEFKKTLSICKPVEKETLKGQALRVIADPLVKKEIIVNEKMDFVGSSMGKGIKIEIKTEK